MSLDLNSPSNKRTGFSALVREDVTELDSEFVQNPLQLIERDVVLAPFNPVQRGVRHADLLGEVCVRQAAPRLPQIFGKLTIQMSLHAPRLAKTSSRMRDDLYLQPRLTVLRRSSWKPGVTLADQRR